MDTLQLVCFLGILMNTNALDLHYYYSGNGGQNGICSTAACAGCGTGQYRSACGNSGGTFPDAQKISAGTCENCGNLPAHATYSDYPPGGTYTNECPFTCNAGYSLSNNLCTPTACTAPAGNTNKELVPGTTSPTCATQCKAGYSGDSATNPTTCTICGIGTFAAAGSTSCTACAAGSSNKHSLCCRPIFC